MIAELCEYLNRLLRGAFPCAFLMELASVATGVLSVARHIMPEGFSVCRKAVDIFKIGTVAPEHRKARWCCSLPRLPLGGEVSCGRWSHMRLTGSLLML